MAQVPYQPIPTVEPSANGSGATYGNVPEANANAFGAQIGTAEEKVGAESEQLGAHYTELANQARADDVISNQLVPATTKIASNYYQTKGMAAHDAYQPTLDALRQAQENSIKDLPIATQNLVRGFSVRHITSLQDGLMRHLDQQQTDYEKKGVNDFVQSQGDLAVAAGSDIGTVNQSIQSAVGRSNLYATNPAGGGINPTDPMGKQILDENARQVTGGIAQKVVGSAIARGDIEFANSVYQQYKGNIDGAQQEAIEKSLHAENLKNTVAGNVAAINSGSPLPAPRIGGQAAVQVKSAVASAAQQRGVDPNDSLMIAGLESSFGTTSENIGQTKGLPAQNQQDHINNMITKQTEAQAVADKIAGGKAPNWQMYIAYQQGPGGGAALLNALNTNPNAKAVDVLSPLYKSPKDVLSAIQGNGGNATMTVKQFTDMLHSKCDTVYGQVACNTEDANGNKIDLGKAILQPHQTGGITQQPTTNPVDAFNNYDLAGALARANEIPNEDVRKGTIEGIKAHVTQLKEVAAQYKENQTSNLRTVTSQPDFISVNDPRLTPEMRSFMAQDQTAYDSVYRQAERNRTVSKEGTTKTPLGSGFSYLQQAAYGGKLNATDMFYHLGDDLTQAGFDKLKAIIKPTVGEAASDNDTMASFLKYGHERIVHSDLFQNTKDAEGAYQQWYASVSKSITDKQKDGVPIGSLIDRNSKDYVGKNINDFLVPLNKQLEDRATRVNTIRPTIQNVQPRLPNESPDDYWKRVGK